MKLLIEPIDPFIKWNNSAEIIEINYSRFGLRFIIAPGQKPEPFLEIFFQYPRAFQVMDEGDMLKFWNDAKLESGHFIYKVIEGGWASRVSQHFLQTTMAVGMPPYEWLIVTNMLCASIISSEAPLLRFFN